MHYKNNINYLLVIVVVTMLIAGSIGCKKFITVPPPTTSINADNVFATDATAIAVLSGIYTKMSASSIISGGATSISLYGGLSADEFALYSGSTNATYLGYYTNSLTNVNTGFTSFWLTHYSIIYTANAAIEGLNKSKTLSPSVKQQLLGEAIFIRAFSYFYLVNLYGDVPLVLTTDYEINSKLKRVPKADVYAQIIEDLKNAVTLLGSTYLDGSLKNYTSSADRVRPTQWAALALLSRVYLFTGDWQKAEIESSKIIGNTTLFDTVSSPNVFIKGSKESIWTLQPVNPGWNTEDARAFVLSTSPTDSRPVYLSPSLINSFEPNDNRKSNWVGIRTDASGTYNFANKYKSAANGAPVTEYHIVLRLAEQYLIRAEARARLNKMSEAQSDLNVIRKRANLSPTTAATETSIITAIANERQIELFTEWGHRWLDIKRTGTVDAIMTIVCPQKGGQWQTTDQLYPIPLTELQRAPQLVQNPGY